MPRLERRELTLEPRLAAREVELHAADLQKGEADELAHRARMRALERRDVTRLDRPGAHLGVEKVGDLFGVAREVTSPLPETFFQRPLMEVSSSIVLAPVDGLPRGGIRHADDARGMSHRARFLVALAERLNLRGRERDAPGHGYTPAGTKRAR